AEDGIRYFHVTGVQTCALPIFLFCPYNYSMVNLYLPFLWIFFAFRFIRYRYSPQTLLSLGSSCSIVSTEASNSLTSNVNECSPAPNDIVPSEMTGFSATIK